MAFYFVGIDGTISNCLQFIFFVDVGLKFQYRDFFVYAFFPSSVLL